MNRIYSFKVAYSDGLDVFAYVEVSGPTILV